MFLSYAQGTEEDFSKVLFDLYADLHGVIKSYVY